MKIVFISDTHTYHNAVKIPDGDILVHCGDTTIYGEIWEMKNFLNWFGQQKHQYKIFINGNHEVQVWIRNYTKQMVADHNKECLTDICYLEESGVEIEGIKFWGSPYTPEFFNWAYMYDREDGKRRWAVIPNDTDVLITHGPPAGVLDEVEPFGRYDRSKSGCDDLLDKVKEIKPRIHAFGHIHAHSGWRKEDETLFINASTCNDKYIPVSAPIVVNTESWKVEEPI
jgi:Icc-related predicted phosphoesterase